MLKKTILIFSSLLLFGCSDKISNISNFENNFSAFAKNNSSKITFVANQNYFPVLMNLLNQKDIKTIDILHYNFFTGTNGAPDQILNKLIELHKTGTKIRIILEGVKNEPNEKNSETLKKLSSAGITDIKLSTVHTTHNKSICINSRFLLLGSTNWTKTSIEKNNETNALIDSEILSNSYIKYIDQIRNNSKNMLPSLTNDGNINLITDSSFYPEAIKLIKSAESSIDIGTYFLAYRKGKEKDDHKVKALLDEIILKNKEIKNQGKKFSVRFFLDNNGISPQHYQNFTLNAAVNARNYLLENGITEFYFDKYQQISHCKFIIKDAGSNNAEVIFGSTNLYKDDFDSHHQLNIKTSEASVVNAFKNYMDERIKESSKEPLKP